MQRNTEQKTAELQHLGNVTAAQVLALCRIRYLLIRVHLATGPLESLATFLSLCALRIYK
jgi:hypothetical protein